MVSLTPSELVLLGIAVLTANVIGNIFRWSPAMSWRDLSWDAIGTALLLTGLVQQQLWVYTTFASMLVVMLVSRIRYKLRGVPGGRSDTPSR